MRKFIIFNVITILSLCFLTFNTFTIKASAETEYRRIITHDTPFYTDATGTELLFYLPYTYYVRVIEHGQILSHVECFGGESSIALDGYVPTTMLFQDDLTVVSPYLKKQITTASTTVLYEDINLTTPIQYVFPARALIYYGQLTNDSNSVIFFVSYNNKLGYVSENTIIPFEIENHPNPLTFLTPEPEPTPPTTEPQQDTGLFTIRILIIICLIFAGVIGLFVALKNKKSNEISYYDDNEYQ